MKFTKKELQNICRICDAVKLKDAKAYKNISYSDAVKLVKDIVKNKIQYGNVKSMGAVVFGFPKNPIAYYYEKDKTLWVEIE